MDDPAAVDGAPLESGTVVGSFRIEQLIGTTGDVQLSRARDQHVDRAVLVHVASGGSATCLLEDARRLGAVETGSFAAVGGLDAMPLSRAGSLSTEEAARVVIDITGAIDALAHVGVSAPITAETVLVSRTAGGVRGLLDPLRAISPGASCLADSDPARSTEELVSLVDRATLAPPPFPRPTGGTSSRRRAVGAAACLLVVALVVLAIVVHGRGSGSLPPEAGRHVPAAQVVARIPLGLPRGEFAVAFAALGRNMWVATNDGRLVRIASGANQVVGSPIKLAGQHPISGVAGSGGNLFTTDYLGWLLRVDPATRRVTGRRHLGPQLTAITLSGHVLWVTSADGPRGSILRVDARTLQTIGKPINALPNPHEIVVRGSEAWVMSYVGTAPKVVYVDAATGTRRITYIGPEANEIALDGSTLWVTDRYNGTLSALDAHRLVFTRPPVSTPRSSQGVLAVGRDVWVTVTDTLDTKGPLRVERFDARSGLRAGEAVAVGRDGSPLSFALGSLWVFTRTTVFRLAPAEPRPALQPRAHGGRPPHALRPGPLRAGTWTTRAFVVPFTFSTSAFVWLANYPEPDSVELDTTGGRDADVNLSTPRQAFATDNALRSVGRPADLLQMLRTNPHLVVGTVRRVLIGSRPALQFELRPRKPIRHPEVCGPLPCVLLFPVQDGTEALSKGQMVRMSLLRASGRTVVIA
jgi:DNA-binding beta-propeller fold protein YncE